jgi:CDP-6-deoxy-D-xylo-4-hexulose-3-dehydrase
MFRSHGMVRELTDPDMKARYVADNPELNPDFIFAVPAYNARNNELGGILGRSQLKRLDANNARRTENFLHFLERIDPNRYRTDFAVEGSSNYAFNLVLKQADMDLAGRLMEAMRKAGIEFRRGSAGGGNQMRQPYLQNLDIGDYRDYPEVEHVHFFGFYIGNFPDLSLAEVDQICDVLNAVN